MHNQLKVSLELLKDDLEFYNNMLKEVSDDILKEGFSEYPVFIAHQDEIKIGDLLLEASEYNRSYNISATVLEDLLEKGVIEQHKSDEFKKAYKNPKENMCILLVIPEGISIIFMPYQKKKTKPNQ